MTPSSRHYPGMLPGVPQFPEFQTVNEHGIIGLRTYVGKQLYCGSVESESGLKGLEADLRQIIKEAK
jgi:hypothetical protein